MPDHSQISHAASPDHHLPSNLYPFNGPAHGDENLAGVMAAIKDMENQQQHHYGDQYDIYKDGYHKGPLEIGVIQIMGSNGEPMDVPIDQLPQFLQDMALYEPDMFGQLMEDMDEDRLAQFINEQELQARINYHHEQLRNDLGAGDGGLFNPQFEPEEEVKEIKHPSRRQ